MWPRLLAISGLIFIGLLILIGIAIAYVRYNKKAFHRSRLADKMSGLLFKDCRRRDSRAIIKYISINDVTEVPEKGKGVYMVKFTIDWPEMRLNNLHLIAYYDSKQDRYSTPQAIGKDTLRRLGGVSTSPQMMARDPMDASPSDPRLIMEPSVGGNVYELHEQGLRPAVQTPDTNLGCTLANYLRCHPGRPGHPVI